MDYYENDAYHLVLIEPWFRLWVFDLVFPNVVMVKVVTIHIQSDFNNILKILCFNCIFQEFHVSFDIIEWTDERSIVNAL